MKLSRVFLFHLADVPTKGKTPIQGCGGDRTRASSIKRRGIHYALLVLIAAAFCKAVASMSNSPGVRSKTSMLYPEVSLPDTTSRLPRLVIMSHAPCEFFSDPYKAISVSQMYRPQSRGKGGFAPHSPLCFKRGDLSSY